jgi:hypothetical protein
MSTVHLILFVYNSVKICSYHNLQLDFGEGILLGNIRRLLEFKTIYPNIRTEPILGVYPPIYQLLSAGVATVVGLNLAAGRIISLLSVAITTYIIYRMAYIEDKFLRFSLPALFLSSPVIMGWGPLMRVDPLAVLFNISGLYIYVYYKGKNRLILSCMMFALAALTKQNMFAGILSVILFLILKKRWREVSTIILYYLTIFLSITASLVFLTGGHYVAHVYLYHWGHPFDISRLEFLLLFLQEHSPMLIGVVGIAFLCKKKEFIIPFCFYVLTTLLSSLLVAKSGAAGNYFIEPLAALVIFLAVSWSHLKRCKHVNSDLMTTTHLYIALILIITIQYTVYAHSMNLIPSLEEDKRFISQMSLLRYLEGINEKVLCADATPCVISGKGPAIDWFILSRVFENNLWNEREFVDIIKRDFSLLVLPFNITSSDNFSTYNNDRFTYNLIMELKDNYTLKGKIGFYYIYAINQSGRIS